MDQFEIKFDNSDQRKFLIPTAEVVLTNLVENHNWKNITKKICCFNTMF